MKSKFIIWKEEEEAEDVLLVLLQRDAEPTPDAKNNDKQGLDGMHDKGESGGIGIADAIEHHHGDDGKMPRACSVGGGNDDGKGTTHKHDQAGQEA